MRGFLGMKDHDPDDDRIKQTETEDLRKALQHAIFKIILQEDRHHQTRTSMDAISALTELTFQYATKALVPDLYAFSTHANRRSTIAADDVALALRKLPPRQVDAFKSVFCRGGANASSTDNNTMNRNRTSDGTNKNATARRHSKSSRSTNNEPSSASRRNRNEIVLSLSSSSSSSAEDEENDAMDTGKRKSTNSKQNLPDRSKRVPSGKAPSRSIGTLNQTATKEQRESLLSKFELASNLDNDSYSPSSSSSMEDDDDDVHKARRIGGRTGGAAKNEARPVKSSRIRDTKRSPAAASNIATKKRRGLATEDSLLQDSSDEEHQFDETNVGRMQSRVAKPRKDTMVTTDIDRPITETSARRFEDPLDGDSSLVDDEGENNPSKWNRKNNVASRPRSVLNDTDDFGGTNKAAVPIARHPKHSQVAFTLANLSDSGMSETNETDNEADNEENSDTRVKFTGRTHNDGLVHTRRARRPAIESDEDE